jgi:inner membrane protein
MASLGHIAAGMAAARLQGGGLARMVGWSALSLLPDADVIAFQFGIPYSAPFGHRGASHSFVAAAAVGLLVGLAEKRSKRVRTGLLAFATVSSHGLLDALTDGGLGIALLWPLSNARYFAPVRPIPVAPIGLGVLSQRGFYVMAVELAMFAPLFLYALWPRRRR